MIETEKFPARGRSRGEAVKLTGIANATVKSRVNRIYSGTLVGQNVLIKVTNPAWGRLKLLNEIAVIDFLGEKTDIPVPRIIDYSINFESDDEALGVLKGQSFLIMEALPGTNWAELEIYHPKHIEFELSLADHLNTLRRFRTNSLGSAINLRKDLDLVAGTIYEIPGKINRAIATRKEFFIFFCNAYLEIIKERQRDQDVSVVVDCELISKVEALLNRWEQLSDTSDRLGFPLSHLDLNRKNILVDPTNGVVTGIVDWEWASFSLPEYEQLSGLDFIRTDDERYEFFRRAGINHQVEQECHKANELLSILYRICACEDWGNDKLSMTARFLVDKQAQVNMGVQGQSTSDIRSFSINDLKEFLST